MRFSVDSSYLSKRFMLVKEVKYNELTRRLESTTFEWEIEDEDPMETLQDLCRSQRESKG